MGYLPPVHHDQYTQYVNRSISQKSNYAHIQKITNIPSERAYREVEKREENQTAAFRRVLEKKRKKTLNRRVAEKAESGRYVNESV
ncbi:hypothetical protein ABE057_18815 [Bacillus paralicheniformis]|uniref:hypothetical protein n=1 Tax=Bacillus TaxID=1386 RepID=UPI001FB9559D|nr:hypothetical protein [Bacillus sp. B19-2]MCJ2145172.1 hypothetical protein [Bacillus sp. B19-2]